MNKIIRAFQLIIEKIQIVALDPVTLARKKGVRLGLNCNINKNIIWGSEPYLINIGDNFYCSSNITFITHDGSVHLLRISDRNKKNCGYFGPIEVGNNVFLGYGVTILPNTKIGSNVIVGACSLVKGELKSNSVYAGVPARYICSTEDYLEKIESQLDNIPIDELEKRKYLSKKYLNQ